MTVVLIAILCFFFYLFMLIDDPIHTDTISMNRILSQSNFLYTDACLPHPKKTVQNLMKPALCCISAEYSLFAKVTVW